MSYSNGNLVREFFSPMQIGVMLHWALSMPYPYGHLDPKLNTSNSFVDLYEPDNYRYTNNESIAFETVQHRGLHKVITGQPVSPTETYCDQDYIKFVVPVGSTYKINIFTEAVTGRPQVNTEIFLIKIESGVEVVLASNDNKNQENLYSEIMEFEIGEGTYWIKVQSKNNTAGEYNLHLERCKVECCQNYLIGSVTEININTGNFNEGVKSGIFSEEFFGKSVSVNGANFGCNIDFPLGIGGHAYPTTNSMLQLDICNEAEIEVINGSFILGDQGTGRKAQVKLNAGTILKIRDKLIINNNSKLIIDAGAKLIYEHGASIELLGTNSIIEIQDGGLIEIGNGATFNWIGKGYLKIINNPYDLGKVNIKAAAGATNAKFIKQGEWVSGEGYIEKLIEVETDTLSFDRSIAEVNVKYGVIELGHEAFVDVEPICYFDNVTFQSNESNQMHNGLWVYGQQNTPYVSGCLFKNALRGITVYPLVKGVGVTLGNEPLSYKSVITNTVFKDCHQSIYINARGAEITNCQITGIGDHPGVRLRGIQYKSFIDKLTARNQAIGIDLLGSGQNEVSVRRSNIHNNGTAGIYGTNVKLSLGCDKIYENYSTSF
ncbi:MAG: hypothetical protein MH472_14670, partial [Bacteroidia bacterium]|nr:hypothetical protein [Bacteroidia bacterium]